VVERASVKRGKVFAVRIRAYGERYFVTLGAEVDGWTLERAQAYADACAHDVRNKTWDPPARKRKRRPNGELTATPLTGDAAKAYGNIRRALQEIDRLRDGTSSAVVRLAAREALQALYVAEDAVGRALRERLDVA
jgi:hypothetical protein